MIYTVIQELKATRSRNDKEAILRREVGNEDLKNFFRLALNPFINFFQKKKFTQQSPPQEGLALPLSSAMLPLELYISGRKLTGNAAIEYINEVLNFLTENDAKVIMHILQKESGCDLGAATINKIWPKLIPTFPTLLATAYDEKLAEKLDWVSGVFSQLKSDGLRVNLVIDEEGGVKAFSRAGNELNFFGVFDFLGNHFNSVVLDGELLTVLPTGKFNNRQTSNGICSKAIKGTMSRAEADMLHITVWDAIPLTDFRKESSQLEYKDRFETLKKLIAVSFTTVAEEAETKLRISVIPSRIVHSIEQAQEHYQEAIAAGEEGTMLKSQRLLWADTRSKLQLKLKAEHPSEFEVIGYKDGVGKLTGNLGSLEIASSDRIVLASMSGYSLKLRSQIYANLTGTPVPYRMVIDDEWVDLVALPGECDINIGSIIECKHNGKIKSRDSATWSVFLPRFDKVRNDKTEANSFAEIK